MTSGKCLCTNFGHLIKSELLHNILLRTIAKKQGASRQSVFLKTMDMPVLVNLDIEVQNVFLVSLYAIQHLLVNREREVYSELSQIPKMELFANRRNGLKPLAIF